MSIVHSFSKLEPVAVALFAIGGVLIFLNNPGVFLFVLLVAGSYWLFVKTEQEKRELNSFCSPLLKWVMGSV